MQAPDRPGYPAPLKFTLLAILWLGLVAFCYHHTNCTVLRAESGLFQSSVHADAAAQRQMLRNFLLQSYHGHYLPLAFLAEIETTKLFGMHRNLWKWRAIVVVVILATLLSNSIYRIARADRCPPAAAAALAFGLSSLIVFHPLMREFVAFPILIFNLAWLILTTVTFRMFIEAIQRPHQKRWIWMAVAAAYASMHWHGLGAITTGISATVIMSILIGIRLGKLPAFAPLRGTWLSALIVLLFLSVAHLIAMMMLMPLSASPAISHPLRLTSFFSLPVCIVVRAAETVLCPWTAGSLWPSLFESRAPFGLLLMLAMLTGWIAVIRSYLHRPNSRSLMRCFLHTFSFAGFVILLSLISARALLEPTEGWFEEYLNGPHHLVPELMIFIPSLTAFALPWARRRHLGRATFVALFGIAMLTSNKLFPHAVYRPFNEAHLSHREAWTAIVAMAQECRAANLPVPDIPTRTLGEFPWTLHYYEPLLQYSLHLPVTQRIQFAPWSSLDKNTMARYDEAVPTLTRVCQLLKVPKD